MTVETSQNVYGFPQLFASNVGQQILAPACILNGLQGAVSVSQAVGTPGLWYVNVNFPKYVERQKYPDVCDSAETTLVDISWMKDNAAFWVNQTLAPSLLPDGNVYNATLVYITQIIGHNPYNFSYGTPSIVFY
jgi:hypothetical protein